MDNKSNKKSKIDSIVKTVLIISIIILLLHNCYLIRLDKENIEKNPTGNVDIIEIKCDKVNVCKSDQENNNNNGINTDNNGNKTNNYANNNSNKLDGNSNVDNGSQQDASDDDNVVVDDNALIVYDSDVSWHGDTPARIFTNSMYGLEDVILPESYNNYQFVVKNGTDYNLK